MKLKSVLRKFTKLFPGLRPSLVVHTDGSELLLAIGDRELRAFFNDACELTEDFILWYRDTLALVTRDLRVACAFLLDLQTIIHFADGSSMDVGIKHKPQGLTPVAFFEFVEEQPSCIMWTTKSELAVSIVRAYCESPTQLNASVLLDFIKERGAPGMTRFVFDRELTCAPA